MLHPAPLRSMPPDPAPASSEPPPPTGSIRPHPWELVLHPIKTVRCMDALRRDPRISLVRKLVSTSHPC